MSASFFETLQGLVGPGVTRVASSALDEHEYGAGKALEAAFAAILCGLERNAGDANTMGEVAKLIGDRSNDTAVLTNVGGLITSNEYASSTSLGERLLATLFGGRTESITSAIARASGVGAQSAATLFAVAGSLVLATLGKRFGAGVPPANTVAGVIAGERNSLAKAIPPYLRNLIGSVRDGGTKSMTGAVAGAGFGSLAWLILPLALLLGMVWVLLVPESVTDPLKTASSSQSAQADRDRDRAASRDSRPADARTERAKEKETRTTKREESALAPRPRETSDWSFDKPPATTTRKPEKPASSSSSSSTWTAPTATPAPVLRRDPPLAGLVRLTLVNGTEIDVVPEGVEQKVIDLVQDRYAVIDKTRWFDFDRIRFRTGSADLTPGSRVQLRNTAAIMKAHPNVAIKIGGYTDNVGDPNANLRLSDSRAKSVMAELVKLGVAPERLEAEGYGDQHPIADNATPDGRAKNRRTAVSVRTK